MKNIVNIIFNQDAWLIVPVVVIGGSGLFVAVCALLSKAFGEGTDVHPGGRND